MSKDKLTNAPGKTKISTIKQEILGKNLCFQQSEKNSQGKEVRKNKSSEHNLLLIPTTKWTKRKYIWENTLIWQYLTSILHSHCTDIAD